MKTIIDAVNYLNGDLGNDEDYAATTETAIGEVLERLPDYCNKVGDIVTVSSGFNRDLIGFICTIVEFNDMVAEMSEGFEEYKRDYISEEIAGTVSVDGMVYEIGKIYEFQHDEEEDWHAGILELVREHEHLKFESTSDFFYKIRECQSQIGTITPAPVELIDGKAYMFTACDVNACGIYRIGGERFMVGICNSYVPADDCINIIPLVPMEK